MKKKLHPNDEMMEKRSRNVLEMSVIKYCMQLNTCKNVIMKHIFVIKRSLVLRFNNFFQVELIFLIKTEKVKNE